jgi:hypothetical protein
MLQMALAGKRVWVRIGSRVCYPLDGAGRKRPIRPPNAGIWQRDHRFYVTCDAEPGLPELR